jgi:glycosyltransferase involved in cell wall biosynthesis
LSDIVVANSDAGLKAYKAPVKKSVTIYNGFNFQRTHNLPLQGVVRDQLGIYQGYVIGMIASYADNKDYDTFFRAAVLLLETRHDLTFLAIGKNTDAIKLNIIIDKQYLRYFRLLGKRSDIESLINAMDICILSTFTEGISNSILEYMAMGKPVIATRGGGTSEIVKDGVSGILVNPCDPVELSREIEKLLSDPQLRESMGSSGKERVRDEFAMEQMVNKYIDVYTNLLSD